MFFKDIGIAADKYRNCVEELSVYFQIEVGSRTPTNGIVGQALGPLVDRASFHDTAEQTRDTNQYFG